MRNMMICVSVMLAVFLGWPLAFGGGEATVLQPTRAEARAPAVTAAVLYLRCGSGWGTGGKGEGKGAGSGGPTTVPAAGPKRCVVRVSAEGIVVDGKKATREEAVAACKTTEGALVTVTGARVTPDLGTAYVNVSVLGDRPEQRNAAFKRLETLTPEIRRALAGRVRHQFKRMPELRFFLDDSPQHAQRMDELFAQIRAERGDSGTGDDEG